MYADDALQLILESKRAAQTGTLPKYNDPLVRQVALEVRQLDASINHIQNDMTHLDLRSDRGTLTKLTVLHLSVRRNKRCLMAYHMGRIETSKQMYWAAGGGLAHLLASDMGSSCLDESITTSTTHSAGGDAASADFNPKFINQESSVNGGTGSVDLRSRCSPHELDFLRSYNDLMMNYKTPYLDVLDLASSISQPPGDLYIDVQVVKDCGVVFTESGQVEFRRGQRYMVKRSDVERLIIQGYLVEV